MAPAYLLVISEREALAWILREQRMAFPRTSRREVDSLAGEDSLFLLTTRGCFHNPRRDRTRIIGEAKVTSPVKPLDPPVELAGREFTRGCDLTISTLSPYRTGLDVAALVPTLEAFPRKATWSVMLRRPLLALTSMDTRLLGERLQAVTGSRSDNLAEYLERIRPVQSHRRSDTGPHR